MADYDLAAEQALIEEHHRRDTAGGGTADIMFAPLDLGHRMHIGPDGVFILTPCSRSEVSEVQARKVIAALTGWLESKREG